jgi:hypothetical protein
MGHLRQERFRLPILDCGFEHGFLVNPQFVNLYAHYSQFSPPVNINIPRAEPDLAGLGRDFFLTIAARVLSLYGLVSMQERSLVNVRDAQTREIFLR